jgi:CheY-like chemotaxis protein
MPPVLDPNSVTILMADDDPEDRQLTRDALAQNRMTGDLRFVVDGEDLMDYLHQRGRWFDPADSPRPGIILLDLNMPRKDGREALVEIKTDPDLRQIPTVVLTSSKAEEDVVRSYMLGANSFITKPVTFTGLAEVMKTWAEYWFQAAEIPPAPSPGF